MKKKRGRCLREFKGGRGGTTNYKKGEYTIERLQTTSVVCSLREGGESLHTHVV